ncbi:MAG: preprotein translocase subunit SecG [Candidatus Aminicenantes bacterium]|nr:preprotein translocase subunit SecG [Candidatus Aminicenantes bacterium]
MDAFLLFVHIVVSFLLIVVVLLQSGKSADLAGAFGGGGSQSTFGPRGAATVLSKVTTTLAVLFMLTSLLLWLRADIKSSSGSVVTDDKVQEQKADDLAGKDKLPTAVTDTEEKKEPTDKKGTTAENKEQNVNPEEKVKEPEPDKDS